MFQNNRSPARGAQTPQAQRISNVRRWRKSMNAITPHRGGVVPALAVATGAGAAGAGQDRRAGRAVGHRRDVGHQLRQRRQARGQGDQRRRRHPRPQDRVHARRHAVESADRQGARAEGGRRRRLRRDGPGVLRLDHRQHGGDADAPRSRTSPAARRRAITQQGNPYIFRTSFTQATAMPKVARYMQGHRQGEDRRDHLGQQRLRQGRPRHDDEGARGAGHQGRRRHLDRSRARSTSPAPC